MEIVTLSSDQLIDGLRNALDRKNVPVDFVCFDFFDTLVSRSVLPEQVKKIAASQLADFYDDTIDGDLLYRLRSVLEKRLCTINQANGNDPEFDVVELADSLYSAISGLTGSVFLNSRDSFTNLFIGIEFIVEKTVQRLNDKVVDALHFCREKGIKTAVVSDFYLPQKYFTKLLTHHNLSNLLDYLFVSADFLYTKGHSGKLYEIVIAETGFHHNKMLMVGDNLHADCHMAKEKGINAIHLNNAESSAKEITNVLQNRSDSKGKQYQTAFDNNKIAYFPEMGLSLHRFIHKLFKQAVGDNCRELFFCSKEGELLRKLFIRYQQIRFGRQVITSHYLLVSRKSTFICSLRDLENETFERLFDYYRDMSLTVFLKSLNFSDAEAKKICQKLKLNPLKQHQNIKYHKDFQTLVGSGYFSELYHSHKQRQKENFHSYLKTFNSDFSEHGFFLVDVGWKGSIQNNLFFTMGGNVAVTGYYIGLLGPTELKENNCKKGILFSDFPQNTKYIHVYNNNRSLFEMILGASHGSADGYFTQAQFKSENRDKFSELAENVFLKDSHPYAVVLDLPDERSLFTEYIQPLQESILKLCDSLTEAAMISDVQPSADWFARMHARSVFKPTREEVDLYSSLYHLENFGIFKFTNFDREKVGLFKKIRNYLAFRKDPAAYVETGVWPPIIFRRLGLDYLTIIDGKRRYMKIFGKNK